MTKKSTRKSRKKIKKSSKLVKSMFWIIVLLVIFVIFLILSQVGFVDYFKKLLETREPQLFAVKDECSLILGNLIHEIKGEDDCKIMCNNRCGLMEMDFYEINFIRSEKDCHVCNCYCK